MSAIAIQARGLAKQYRIGESRPYRTLRESLTRMFARKSASHTAHIWALNDVSFDIEHGEAVGIIGRNGAGKSTLLKVLARITAPTRGVADLYGRIGSLLEVGTGFHPELTGRENIYLNGAILGMQRLEIGRKLDEVIAFAEVETFIDTPVKFYSSGMYMRLAFSVAAHLEPEILLVDEALAVGDAGFQKKALGKMDQAANNGRTVLFVSHNLDAVLSLTRRGLVIDAGRIVFDGPSDEAVRQYRRSFGETGLPAYSNPEVNVGVREAKVITSDASGVHRFGEPLEFEFKLRLNRQVTAYDFAFQVLDEHYRAVINPRLIDRERVCSQAELVTLRCRLPHPRLYMGRYSLRMHLGDRSSMVHWETVDAICEFEIVMDAQPEGAAWLPGAGAYIEDAEWESTAPEENRRSEGTADTQSLR